MRAVKKKVDKINSELPEMEQRFFHPNWKVMMLSLGDSGKEKDDDWLTVKLDRFEQSIYNKVFHAGLGGDREAFQLLLTRLQTVTTLKPSEYDSMVAKREADKEAVIETKNKFDKEIDEMF
jgi:hypothetical protein